MMNTLTITHYEMDGDKLVSIPAINVEQSVILYEDDLQLLRQLSVQPFFRIVGGQVFGAGGLSRISIPRVLMDAGKGQKIVFKDGNGLNLKRDNLVVVAGNATKFRARDQIHHATTTYIRNKVIKHIVMTNDEVAGIGMS